jgi:hypothetical protein
MMVKVRELLVKDMINPRWAGGRGTFHYHRKHLHEPPVFPGERAILPPDLRKMCGTVADRPAPRNHFWEQVTQHPHLEVTT